MSNRPFIVLAYGHPDFLFSEGKLLQLLVQFRTFIPGAECLVLTDHEEVEKAAQEKQLRAVRIPMDSRGVSLDERLAAVDEIIEVTDGLPLPGTDMPLWKTLAMDDFAGSLMSYGTRPLLDLPSDAPGVCLMPIMGIDNNSREASALYVWVAERARTKGIPTMGIEVSPIGNKQTFSHLQPDYWLVRSKYAARFIKEMDLAPESRVGFLRPEEIYLTHPGHEVYPEAYLQNEKALRDKLKVEHTDSVVLVPFHIAGIYESRKILEAMVSFQDVIPNLNVVVKADPNIRRRGISEVQMVQAVCGETLAKLQKCVVSIDDGEGLLVQLADLIVAPNASIYTLRGQQFGKPAVIYQAGAWERDEGLIRWIGSVERLGNVLREVPDQSPLRRSMLVTVRAILAAQMQNREECLPQRAVNL